MAATDSGPYFSSSSSPCPGALFFPCSTFKSWMRNELPAKHLLQPIPTLPLAEKRKSRQATSSVARRWHVARAVPFLLQPDEKRKIYPIEQGLSRWTGCARCPVRPIFIPFSHFLPRVFSSVLFPLCFAPSNVEREQPVAATDSGPYFSSSSSPCPGAPVFPRSIFWPGLSTATAPFASFPARKEEIKKQSPRLYKYNLIWKRAPCLAPSTAHLF